MNQITVAATPRLDAFVDQVLPPDMAADLYKSLSHIKPEVFKRNLANALMANPALMGYHPSLVYREVSKAAGLSLLLDPQLGEAYIIEAYNYKSKRKEPQLRIGYRGLLKLARQTGNVTTIYAHAVHEKDDVEVDQGFPKVFHHRPKLFSDRGPVLGYVAIIAFKDGTFDFEPMPLPEILSIRDRSDAWKAFKAGQIKSTPWNTDEGEMCRKTVLRRLSKRQDLSPEYRQAVQIEDEAEFPTMVAGVANAPQIGRDAGPPLLAADTAPPQGDLTVSPERGNAEEAAAEDTGPPDDGAPPVGDRPDWLKELDAALSGCEDAASLHEEQLRVMAPMKDKVSRQEWAEAEIILQEHIKRVSG
jgi:phage RecT family recombinase